MSMEAAVRNAKDINKLIDIVSDLIKLINQLTDRVEKLERGI